MNRYRKFLQPKLQKIELQKQPT